MAPSDRTFERASANDEVGEFVDSAGLAPVRYLPWASPVIVDEMIAQHRNNSNVALSISGTASTNIVTNADGFSGPTAEEPLDPVAAVREELKRRGIQPKISEIAEAIDEGAQLEAALALGNRRSRQLEGLDRTTATRRLSGFLQRRGYSYDIVRKVIDEVIPR